MKYTTEIDTIKIQIDCLSKREQRERLTELTQSIKKLDYIHVKYPKYPEEIATTFFYKRNKIFNIKTGAFPKYDGSDITTVFYLSVEFAGLKSYDNKRDSLSLSLLFRVYAYFKTRKIKYKLSKIDICIDAECKLEHIVTVCTKRTSKTEYYALTEEQVYVDTHYNEKIDKKKLNHVASRSYTYNKTKKEGLHCDMTRFELKLQTNHFSNNGTQMDAIENALNRYCVMYFEDLDLKHSKIEAYDKYKVVRSRELKRLDFEKYQLHPDISFIEHFLTTLFNIEEHMLDVDMTDI